MRVWGLRDVRLPTFQCLSFVNRFSFGANSKGYARDEQGIGNP